MSRLPLVCFADEETHHLDDHTLGKADRDSVTDPWLPAMSDTEKTMSGPAPRVLPRGIDPLCQLNLERKQPPDHLLRLFDDSSDKDRSRCPVCVPARDHHAL